MLSNYLKFMLRYFSKNKGYVFINVLGLGVGIACFILIMLWVQDEISYDLHHKNSSRLFRIVLTDKSSGEKVKYGVTSGPIAPAFKDEFPQVENYVRHMIPVNRKALVQNKEKDIRIYEEHFIWADAQIFDLFTFEFIEGNPSTALLGSNKVVITEEKAKTYFGNESALGKRITSSVKLLATEDERDYQITGVIKNLPENSHIKINFLASIETINTMRPGHLQDWDNHSLFSFILLNNPEEAQKIQNQVPEFIKRHFDENTAANIGLFIQPLKDIHLTNDVLFEPSPTGNSTYVLVFSLVATSILIIAAINFINLSTARSAKREKEVGVKKVVGASRSSLLLQFTGEAIFLSFISLLLALFIVQILLPVFNEITGKKLFLGLFGNFYTIPFLILTTFFTGFISGIYPGLYLSGFQPAKILKGKSSSNTMNAYLRKVLIVGQFVVTVILLIGTGIVYNQLNFFSTVKLGFAKDQILIVQLNNSESILNLETFKERVKQDSQVESVALSTDLPGASFPQWSMQKENSTAEEILTVPNLGIDFDFVETMGLELIAGRNFSLNFPTDSSAFMVNEAGMRFFGFSNPEDIINVRLDNLERAKSGRVIGVLKDFNFQSLEEKVPPLTFDIQPGFFNYFFIRLKSKDMLKTVKYVESVWNEMVPSRPFVYEFMDENYDGLYKGEARMSKIFTAFSILAIFIGCLGLFGLSSYMAEQRKREIGIRKVLGATTNKIIQILSVDFILLIIVANVIAWPIAYFLMDKWLQNFENRVDISFGTFVIASIISIVISMLTVGNQALQASKTNPVEALKYE